MCKTHNDIKVEKFIYTFQNIYIYIFISFVLSISLIYVISHFQFGSRHPDDLLCKHPAAPGVRKQRSSRRRCERAPRIDTGCPFGLRKEDLLDVRN